MLPFFNRKYIAAHWIDFEDPESGIHHYEWCIGTSADACDVTPMENVYTSLSASAANLSLTTGSKYYVTVNAFNNVGLSVNQTSLPVTMDTTPPAFQAVPKVANSVRLTSPAQGHHIANVGYWPSRGNPD